MPQGLRWFRSRCAVLIALAVTACAAPGSDIHLAPLYTRIATADGGTLVEIAGGLYRQHRRDDGNFLEWQTLAPFWGIERQRNGDYEAETLFPLGRTRKSAERTISYLVPLYVGRKGVDIEGRERSFWVTLPGLMYQRVGDETHGGWFPFYGHFEDLLTFDDARFVLWPLYVSNERAGRTSHHLLWPFFGWTHGGGESSWHLFPLLARAHWEDRYDRWYFLWPFFHWQRNNLGGGTEEPEKAWWFFPFIGHKTRGTYSSWSFLWPLFGFAHDSRSGFWSLDCPFFLVRVQRGPKDVDRTRFWPFYSHLRADGLDDKSYLWPIGHVRHEESPEMVRDSTAVVPFWLSWDRSDKATAETASWRKLWPLFRYERWGEWRSGALLELDPFFRNDSMPRYVTGIFRLWEWEEEPAFRRERSFLGLWRRERGRGEDRRSIAGLWAHRSYSDERGEVRETSLLFGLVRWRVTEADGFDMLAPAFPGPGWPRPVVPASAAESRTFF